MNNYLTLLLGVFCAGLGGELFVRGVVGLASWLRIAPGVIGATVAAFATSSPEMAVSISAALAEKPQIALGDALGSNIVNVAVILGVALLMSAIRAPRNDLRRDFPLAMLTPLLIGVLSLDGQISRFDGVFLMTVFVVWLVFVTRDAMSARDTSDHDDVTDEVLGETNRAFVLWQNVGGLILLIAAGHFIVTGAKGLASSWGWNEFVVGITVVALATSTPEMATTLMARLRGHDEVGLGTLLGSNIFNLLLIIGVAATIAPIPVRPQEIALSLGAGFLALLLAFPTRDGWIPRARGGFLLAVYGVYLWLILRGGTN